MESFSSFFCCSDMVRTPNYILCLAHVLSQALVLHMEKWLGNYCFLWKSCNNSSTQETYILSTRGSFSRFTVLEKYDESLPRALACRTTRSSLLLVFFWQKERIPVQTQVWRAEIHFPKAREVNMCYKNLFLPLDEGKSSGGGVRGGFFLGWWLCWVKSALLRCWGCSPPSSWNLKLWMLLNLLQSKRVCQKMPTPTFPAPKGIFEAVWADLHRWEQPGGDSAGKLGVAWDPGGRGAVPGTPGSGPCPWTTICHRHGGQAEANQFHLNCFTSSNETRSDGGFWCGFHSSGW